jgi:hypothetical protein
LMKLRDSRKEKDHLAFLYLCHRSLGTPWEKSYKMAAALYLSNPDNVSLFGILIRDVGPDQNDLKKAAYRLANQCPEKTSISFYGIYLPEGSIRGLSNHAADVRNTAK